MNRIYFAHPINTYSTPLEDAILILLDHEFPDTEIENPNQDHHEAGYEERDDREHESDTEHEGMQYYYEEVLPDCEAGCVALPYLDGRLGLGVAGEVAEVVSSDDNRPVYLIEPIVIPSRKELLELIYDPVESSLFRIRSFRNLEIRRLLNFDKDEGNSLVLAHEETRLRTWFEYKNWDKMRPYLEAHHAPTEVYDGFYPDE